ncbi:MAG: HAMP domain-containing protein [Anaerolineae bacterium]|nr:HAMP domain-containing protein [Anaerolineae bacterium]
MRNISLRTRLLAGFLLPVLVLVALAYGTIVQTRRLGAEFDTVAAYDLALVSALDEVKFYGARVISSTNELILDHAIGREDLVDSVDIEAGGETTQIDSARDSMWAAFRRYEELVTNNDRVANSANNVDMSAEIESAAQELVGDSARIIELKDSEADLWDILGRRSTFEQAEIAFLSTIDQALGYEMQELSTRRANVNDGIDRALRTETLLSIAAILMIMAVSNIIYRSIHEPLAKLNATATAYSRGNLDARTGITGSDELGEVARTFDHMARELEISINELEAQTIDAVLAREQAERSDRVKSQFLASVSHELRTPLNAVLNFTQFVSSGMMGDVNERQVDALTKVYNSGAHLLDVINDVLDISKIEADSLQLFVESDINLNKELSLVVDSAETALRGKPVRLNVDIPEDLPPIMGDRQRIRQIMLNLIGNACKFTDEGEVTLKVEQVDNNVVFTIRDTGPGIAQDEQETLYDPFQQGMAGLRHGGTGLGLPICKRLVEAHGGTISFESTPGKGTTFYVSLPIRSTVLEPLQA